MNQNNNDIWVYYNGELYHAGVKGMQWGKHLPGTDWWKEATGRYAMNNPGRKANSARANLYAAGQAAKLYGGYIGNNAKVLARNGYNAAKKGASNAYKAAKKGVSNAYNAAKKGTSKLWNSAKGFSEKRIKELKESARKAYKTVRTEVQNVLNSYHGSSIKYYADKPLVTGKSGYNELSFRVNKQQSEAILSYSSKMVNGPIGDQINSFIQITQANIVTGCARFLDSIGMDDEVESFLKKIGL